MSHLGTGRASKGVFCTKVNQFFCKNVDFGQPREMRFCIHKTGVLMKRVTKVAMGVLASLMLVNCKLANEGFNVEVTPLDTDEGKIEYSHGGWYPAPNTPNFELILSMTLEDGRVTVDAEEPGCRGSGEVSLDKYTAIEKALLNARKTRSSSHGIDMGDEKITVTKNGGTKTDYLRHGDSTYNQLVIEKTDADHIAKLIGNVASEVLNNCLTSIDQDLVGVRYVHNVWANIGSEKYYSANYEMPQAGEYSDLQVSFGSQDKVHISGVTQRGAGTAICRASINDTIFDAELKAAAKKIQIKSGFAVCDVMMGYKPTQFALEYLNKPLEVGSLGCESGNRALNTEAFVKRLKQIVSNKKYYCQPLLSSH